MIHFELTFVYGLRLGSNFILFTHLSQQYVLEKLISYGMVLVSSSKRVYQKCKILFPFIYMINLLPGVTVLISMAMQENLKSESLPSGFVFFFKIVLALLIFLNFFVSFKIILSISAKNFQVRFNDCVEFVHQFQVLTFKQYCLRAHEHWTSFHLFRSSLISTVFQTFQSTSFIPFLLSIFSCILFLMLYGRKEFSSTLFGYLAMSEN